MMSYITVRKLSSKQMQIFHSNILQSKSLVSY